MSGEINTLKRRYDQVVMPLSTLQSKLQEVVDALILGQKCVKILKKKLQKKDKASDLCALNLMEREIHRIEVQGTRLSYKILKRRKNEQPRKRRRLA